MYIKGTENFFIAYPKKSWSYVNGISKCDELPNQISLGDEHVDTAVGIAIMFAKYFKSVYSPPFEQVEQSTSFDSTDSIIVPVVYISKEEI